MARAWEARDRAEAQPFQQRIDRLGEERDEAFKELTTLRQEFDGVLRELQGVQQDLDRLREAVDPAPTSASSSSRQQDIPEFLATQWMSVKQFGDAGISCRKGPFTREEVGQVHAALGTYKKENDLDDEQLDDLIYSSQPTNGFWSRIARAVPQRGVKSVFYHVRRARDPLAKAGKWGAAEDEQLRSAHRPTVATGFAHTQYQGIRRRDLLTLHLYGKGAWSSEEEGQLHHAIEELAREGKSDMSARGFWVSISKAMGSDPGHQSSVKANGL
ncbi:hypothetical protein F5148DRAFT_1151097 [Russula earlei]|uniref:Uncharacterized protein n=1 Tax=Russula earlei TaxID=71964 RepID=A0ACC0U1I9_9AGAM|nr:hypothetical protein F5148DRAFT_1151097 [Russula earlei]